MLFCENEIGKMLLFCRKYGRIMAVSVQIDKGDRDIKGEDNNIKIKFFIYMQRKKCGLYRWQGKCGKALEKRGRNLSFFVL